MMSDIFLLICLSSNFFICCKTSVNIMFLNVSIKYYVFECLYFAVSAEEG